MGRPKELSISDRLYRTRRRRSWKASWSRIFCILLVFL